MKEFLSTVEAAEILGVSRVTLFNKIKSGEIEAIKVGRNYIISRDVIINYSKKGELTDARKREIEKEVDKVIKEYGETLELLKDN
ncbi:helix-turn-helix domain-containing protein [Patescibacteria group bacterium]|nr:helix-turn-helix domain-containing protein [Patescibacteria group bacterium]MBU1016107.1 helix-turn-helix domain-containing protein [Patescibacteria group bacterium]MBU1684850.1 helix-turn-helix domain-containing protein [Patescibacteria group bacterium]MBU1938566.1 helix-turn-helix domain-containing protein [Patescibacteria group bacterium]